ncbi:hypothetical protein NL676_036797 [Syzygium grande]|nr:hypothetical protein NL676_036797 [Syzygium grande]
MTTSLSASPFRLNRQSELAHVSWRLFSSAPPIAPQTDIEPRLRSLCERPNARFAEAASLLHSQSIRVRLLPARPAATSSMPW